MVIKQKNIAAIMNRRSVIYHNFKGVKGMKKCCELFEK